MVREHFFVVSAKYFLQPWRTAIKHALGALDALSSHISGCIGSENLRILEKWCAALLFRFQKPEIFCANVMYATLEFCQWIWPSLQTYFVKPLQVQSHQYHMTQLSFKKMKPLFFEKSYNAILVRDKFWCKCRISLAIMTSWIKT